MTDCVLATVAVVAAVTQRTSKLTTRQRAIPGAIASGEWHCRAPAAAAAQRRQHACLSQHPAQRRPALAALWEWRSAQVTRCHTTLAVVSFMLVSASMLALQYRLMIAVV